MNRKLGKIQVDWELVYERPMDLLPIFTKFVPVHIESRPHMRDFVYTGYSEDFRKLAEGESIPTYSVIIDASGQIIQPVTFKE